MAVIHTGETDHDKELKRWDTPKSQGGMKCDGFEPFPRMFYQAWQRSDGRVVVLDAEHTHAGTAIAKDAGEAETLRRQGWHESIGQAMDAYDAQTLETAHQATRVAYDVSQMSEQAQREYAALDAQSTTHVLDVPAPKKRRYRRKRAATTVATE